MNAVTTLKAHLTSIQCPSELRTLQAWVMWRIEYHEGEDKPRKIPYYASGARRAGQQGSPDDRRSLVTFDAARSAAARKGMDGVGLALLPELGVCALDFDKCVLPSGELQPEVAAIAAQSYAEWSPSGQGVRVLFKGNLLNRKSFDGDFGFETFSTKGFVTFTGNRLDITDLLGNEDTVSEITDEVRNLYRKRFTREDREAVGHNDDVVGLSPEEIQRALDALDPGMGHDDWRNVGMALHHETRGDGFEAWDEWSSSSDKYPGRDVLRRRWDSFGRNDGPSVTGRTLVRMAAEHGVYVGPSAPAKAEDFEVVDVAAIEAAEAAKPLKYQFEPAHLFAQVKPGQWWIKGVLPKAQLAVVYGASGSGKSFAVLDMAFAIARGAAWRDKRVRQGRVAYIAAEGADGFRKRLAAYAQHNELELQGVPLMVLGTAPNLRDPKDSAAVAAAVNAGGGADLIVVDTFAQVTPGGNENASEDVGQALAHAKRIAEATGAMVLLVHHAGKDAARGARGWSGLRAAADAEIEVVRTDNGSRYMRLSKSKDGEDGAEWGFELVQVVLGMDEDGDAVTSCVVREAEVNKAKAAGRKLGPNEEIVNQVIQEIAVSQLVGIEVEAVVEEAARRLPEPTDGKRDTRKQVVRRALKAMCADDSLPYELCDDGTINVL